MQQQRRGKLLAELIKYLEDLDGEDLKSSMAPPPSVEIEVEKMDPDDEHKDGPMEKLMADKGVEKDEDEPDDDELDEMMKDFA